MKPPAVSLQHPPLLGTPPHHQLYPPQHPQMTDLCLIRQNRSRLRPIEPYVAKVCSDYTCSQQHILF
jgi:hypothetical protein